MPITSRLPPNSAFDPETIVLLTGAFEDAWRALASGGATVSDAEETREMLAKQS